MKEPYGEGLATHTDPESCARGPRGRGEALTGAHAGWVSSHEIYPFEAPTLWDYGEGHTDGRAMASVRRAWLRSETPRTHGNSPRGNREISRVAVPSTGRSASGRLEEP